MAGAAGFAAPPGDPWDAWLRWKPTFHQVIRLHKVSVSQCARGFKNKHFPKHCDFENLQKQCKPSTFLLHKPRISQGFLDGIQKTIVLKTSSFWNPTKTTRTLRDEDVRGRRGRKFLNWRRRENVWIP